MPFGTSIASINPDTQRVVEETNQQLAQQHAELVKILSHPPNGIDVTIDKNKRHKPEDSPLMFSIKILTDDGKTRTVNVSYMRNRTSRIRHAIVLEGVTKDDKQTESDWKDYIILPDGTLPGYANGDEELTASQSVIDCCDQILKAVADRITPSAELMTIQGTK